MNAHTLSVEVFKSELPCLMLSFRPRQLRSLTAPLADVHRYPISVDVGCWSMHGKIDPLVSRLQSRGRVSIDIYYFARISKRKKENFIPHIARWTKNFLKVKKMDTINSKTFFHHFFYKIYSNIYRNIHTHISLLKLKY